MLSRENNKSPLFQFYYKFLDRHDFVDEDIKVLAKNFPNVLFHHIPQAWIIPIDEMLRDIFEFDKLPFFGSVIVKRIFTYYDDR